MTNIIHVPYDNFSRNLPVDLNIPTSSKISRKINLFFSKVKTFFTKRETKLSAIITYWSAETVLFGYLIFSLTSVASIATAAFLYLYGTYALFSAANIIAS